MHIGGFELVRHLAQGGMADVYLARCPQSDRTVALKVLFGGDPEAQALFHEEGRVGAWLDHQNVVRVLAAGDEGGMRYMAMEYVSGVDLCELATGLRRQGRTMSYAQAIAIVAGAAAGLDHAHRRCAPNGTPLRVVHRDVSPSNIMVGEDGAVKVIDFGIAQAETSRVATKPNVVRGKPSYMSPEQCSGGAVDQRTDVFALGAVLYELTTGRRCFRGNSDFACMLSVLRGSYDRPSGFVLGFPPGLERVIARALAPNPEDRYTSAAQMRIALEALGSATRCELAALVADVGEVGKVVSDTVEMETMVWAA